MLTHWSYVFLALTHLCFQFCNTASLWPRRWYWCLSREIECGPMTQCTHECLPGAHMNASELPHELFHTSINLIFQHPYLFLGWISINNWIVTVTSDPHALKNSWSIYPYFAGLLQWHYRELMANLVPVKITKSTSMIQSPNLIWHKLHHMTRIASNYIPCKIILGISSRVMKNPWDWQTNTWRFVWAHEWVQRHGSSGSMDSIQYLWAEFNIFSLAVVGITSATCHPAWLNAKHIARLTNNRL